HYLHRLTKGGDARALAYSRLDGSDLEHDTLTDEPIVRPRRLAACLRHHPGADAIENHLVVVARLDDLLGQGRCIGPTSGAFIGGCLACSSRECQYHARAVLAHWDEALGPLLAADVVTAGVEHDEMNRVRRSSLQDVDNLAQLDTAHFEFGVAGVACVFRHQNVVNPNR